MPLASQDPSTNTLAQSCERLAADWEHDARARRRLTPHDLAADTLDYCASALRQALVQVAEAFVELTTAEYAALHGKKEPTVRRWCASGAVRARRSGRTWLIAAGEQPPTFGGGDDAAPATEQAA